MKTCLRFMAVLALLMLPTAQSSFAQQTTGTIAGRVVDPQGMAVPGANVTATSTTTGLVRTDVTDSGGLYRLSALPVGTYDVVTELSGFTRVERKGILVDVSTATDLNLTLRVASVAETVTVEGQSPLIPTTSSSVGQVVDVTRIERLPLNGRQFANLAETVPGVGIGFHSDPTKATQYSPQISGTNGRSLNYVVDGGDNNDDTVGGLLQMYPLESIQQFNVLTQRYDAQFGRSAGGVINVVTKSGTNEMRGSWFTLFRDTAMNAQTETEKLSQLPKQDYRRYQYGGSLGGPIMLNRIHYFAAFERTQQDTTQVVNTLGLFPAQDGVYPTPVRENLFDGKVTVNARDQHYLSFRYGRDVNSAPDGAGFRAAPSSWSTSTNHFNSTNGSDNWVESQRTRIPVLHLHQHHSRKQHVAVAGLPEWRHLRRRPERAAVDRTDEVAARRRRDVDKERLGPRAHVQGWRRVDPRAAPVHQHDVGRQRRLLDGCQQRERPRPAGDGDRRRSAGEHSAQFLRGLPAGRLAGHEQADVQPWRALRLRGRHAVEPGQQSKLPRAPDGRRRGALRRHAAGRLRQDAAGRQEQHPAAAWFRV
jgi:hypothetical protein